MALAIAVILLLLVQCHSISSGSSSEPEMAGEWAVELTRDEGMSNRQLEERAKNIAEENGLHYRGPVVGMRSVFQLTAPKSAAGNNSELTRSLELNEEIVVVEQQQLLLRVLRREQPLPETKPITVPTSYSENHEKYNIRKRGANNYFSFPSDPLWNRQWSLYNIGQSGGKSGMDINILPAWIQGYTGRGITVSIVDDGLDRKHPDLNGNFDWTASLNIIDSSNDPSPSSSHDNHGTKCAGIVAMEKNNEHCGVGVAHNVNLGGITFDLSQVTDLMESSLLTHQPDYISVYSCSWGPSDSGFTVAGPYKYTQAALKQGATEGRNGLGNIYVFASGNGGANGDSCAADGYVNSIYTIAVGSADETGKQAFFDESCTSKIAVTYSFNSHTFNSGVYYSSDQLTTTTLDDSCTDSFTGTSASAPIMSGVTALVLQAKPELSWRDIQYLVAYTSNYLPLKSSDDWTTNGGSLKVSHKFGFGALDTEAMVTRARNWIPVPEQQNCILYPDNSYSGTTATADNPLSLTYTVDDSSCYDVGFLEHVIITATISLNIDGYDEYYEGEYYEDESVLDHNGPRRGDISVKLTSPSGTTSTLLPKRPNDYVNTNGYYQWNFMSLHYWGESPTGTWTLEVDYDSNAGSASLDNYYVTLYGTESIPSAVERIPKKCSSQCARGCAAKGSDYCDACKRLRIPSSLRCVNSCPSGLCGVSGYCIHCNPYALSSQAIIGIAAGAITLVLLSASLLTVVWAKKCQSSSSRSNYDTI